MRFGTLLALTLGVVRTLQVDQQSPSVYSYRMAFGSCFIHEGHYTNSEIMKKIVAERPDSFVWLGDFAYVDDFAYKLWFGYVQNPIDVVRRLFSISYNDPGYTELRKSAKIYGVWDDHDSGINNSDKTNPDKEIVRQIFLDSLDEPADSPRRVQAGGMYGSYYLDPHNKIKLILLDVRYSRDSLSDTTKTFDEKSLLGDEQEAWFLKEVQESEAHFTLIGLGNQVIPDDRPLLEQVFPRTRELLLTIHNPKTSIFLITGDVHFGEILVDDCTRHIHGYPIHEFVSSGLTHAASDLATGRFTDEVLDFLFPSTYSTVGRRYNSLNYAVLDFNIDLASPSNSSVAFKLRGVEGQTVLEKAFSVGRDLPKAAYPDMLTYHTCLSARGSPLARTVKNMLEKASDPTGVIFYLLLGLLTVTALVSFWLIKFLLYCHQSLTSLGKQKKE